ncbi:soma ferritin-like [Asterias amurensis]|uniref:soma ferritin-like n=1 Tax=Asterias amurensis TaxID=7602 RepID=UPI003AB5DE9C
MASTPVPEVRQNFPRDCESGINKQIHMQLQGSYFYLGMAYHFDRSDVALPGFKSYCQKLSDKKKNVASSLMVYQNKRGGKIYLQDIKSLNHDFSTGQKAFEVALVHEKEVNKALLELVNVAVANKDAQFKSFLGDFLREQMLLIKELGDHLRNISRAGPNLGEYFFDTKTLSS